METYNGYTNFETWSVKATIDNTQSLYNFFRDWVKEVKTKTTDKNKRISATIDVLKQVMENMKPNTNNPIWGPLINAVIEDHINFREIAEELLGDD